MLNTLLKVAVILIIGILLYNYFLGTPEERSSSERIFDEVRDLGTATWDLLKAEKEKFDDGKYDEAIQKMEDLFVSIRDQAGELTEQASDQLDDLERRRQEIGEQLQQAEEMSRDERRRLQREWDDLTAETEALMKEIEAQ